MRKILKNVLLKNQSGEGRIENEEFPRAVMPPQCFRVWFPSVHLPENAGTEVISLPRAGKGSWGLNHKTVK